MWNAVDYKPEIRDKSLGHECEYKTSPETVGIIVDRMKRIGYPTVIWQVQGTCFPVDFRWNSGRLIFLEGFLFFDILKKCFCPRDRALPKESNAFDLILVDYFTR